MEKKEYRDMSTTDPATANVRYHLFPSDHATLYRKFSRRFGVDVRKLPQYNVHDWLDPTSSNFKTEIYEAVFHYGARSDAGERFKVCIATQEMRDAAWKYVHGSQLVLDGTFGICSVRLLLFIALGKDEDGKGVPVAFFLFSAPTGNKATHAGYNTEILRELLSHWKAAMASKPTADTGTGIFPETFKPYVAITDTDTKERGALLAVWPDICLLLCRFHVRQCWTNHRKTVLKSKGSEYWRDWVLNALRSLEVLYVILIHFIILELTRWSRLLATVDHIVATDLISRQNSVFEQLSANPTADSYVHAQGGQKHLNYLTANWMPLALWQSWSEFGRMSASALLKIPVEGVIPTTNNLESFNGLLKRKHLATWLRSGHRLRFDFLINILITRILPAVYSHRKAQRQYKQWLGSRFKDHVGGTNLSELHAALVKERSAQRNIPICWWDADIERDRSAQNLVISSQLIVSRRGPGIYQATCHSTAPVNAIHLGVPTSYTLELHQSGRETKCSCPDFCTRGGACKHLRALRLIIDSWVKQGHEKPFHYSKTRDEAILLRNNIPIPQLAIQPLHPTQMTPTLWDPAFIQSLGQDSTTFDDLETTVTDTAAHDSDSNSDSFSYAVDLAQQNQHIRVPIGPPVQLQSLAAIATQIQRRLKYDLHRLLPSLHGLANLLSDASTQSITPELEEFSELLSSMRVSVDHIMTQSGTRLNSEASIPSRPSDLPQAATQHPPSERARHPFLLPPSPERRQKRKESYAPL